MSKHRKSKAKNQTFHFQRRCDERLGVQIDRKKLQRRIKDQKFDENFYFLDRQSNRVTRYRYKFNNKWYIVPYDKNTHKVVTIFEDKKQDIKEVISEIQVKRDFVHYLNMELKFFTDTINTFFKKLF